MTDNTNNLTGVQRITAERQRQLEKEGWSSAHDDKHEGNELAIVAICYAASASNFPIYTKEEQLNGGASFYDPWPETWDDCWDKRPVDDSGELIACDDPRERIRMLEKAGALIAAEIDRLLRACEFCGANKQHCSCSEEHEP